MAIPVVSKDIGVARDVQQMAAYGYFQEEFLIYGYAFKRGRQTVYKLSEDPLSIQQAYHGSVFEDVYPTPICSWLKSVMVPSGEQMSYKTQFKMELIQYLRKYYGQPFFDATKLWQDTQAVDTAYELLVQYQKRLAPQAEKRQVFDGMCQQALEAKLLTKRSYQELMQRTDRLYGQGQNILKPIDGRGKLFSGFAYWSADEAVRYYFSATLEDTYHKYAQLRQKGLSCTPIVQKSYWCDSPNDFKPTRQAFIDFCHALVEADEIISMIDQLNALPTTVNRQHYQMMLDKLQSDGSSEAYAALVSYGYRFHLQ